MDPKIKEAVGHFLSKEPAKAFETLNSVMEQRTLELLQNKMAEVGKKMFGESTGHQPHPGPSKHPDPNHISNMYAKDVDVKHKTKGTHLGSVGKLANGKHRVHSTWTNHQTDHDSHEEAVAALHKYHDEKHG